MEDDHLSSEDEYRHVTERLRTYGAAPISAEIAGAALGRARGRGARASAGRAKWVVAATLAGFVAGGVGLAAADVLPASVQDVAHHALDTVGVHVPPGHQRFNDPTACPGGPYANHGAYVRAHHDDPNAGTSPCGKPLQAVDPAHGANTNEDQPGTHGKSQGKNKGASKPSHDTNPGNHGALKPHGKSDDKPDTNPEQPADHATTTTSMSPSSAPTTTSAPPTTTTTSTTNPTP